MTALPTMPLAEWQETKETLHRFLQVVGKVRLASSARRNHWWNVRFYESSYRAGAELAGWDLVRYTCRDGITDPRPSEVVP